MEGKGGGGQGERTKPTINHLITLVAQSPDTGTLWTPSTSRLFGLPLPLCPSEVVVRVSVTWQHVAQAFSVQRLQWVGVGLFYWPYSR